MKQTAVLITCHNRSNKTLALINSFYNCINPDLYLFDIFVVDAGSTDCTVSLINSTFPNVNTFNESDKLFWAGGTRKAWEIAISLKEYDSFLLLNDDVILDKNCLCKLLETHNYSLAKFKKSGIYIGTTIHPNLQKYTYGGHIISMNHIFVKYKLVIPNRIPQNCHLANANILWVSNDVVKQIGIFDNKFTHGIADYDYTLTAHEKKIPLLVAPGVCGTCEDDHGNNWYSNKYTLKNRILFLRSPKGLAYNEYLYYIKKHFPINYPYSFLMLWIKTFFPFFWEKFKK